MSSFRSLFACCLLGLIAVGVTLWALRGDPASDEVISCELAPPPQEDLVENNKVFHAELLGIAKNYRSYGRVDDETRWAPWLCRMPMPGRARFSKSDDAETHGEKLYYLFARDREAYLKVAQGAESKTGQVVVKESWRPKETTRELSPQLWKDTFHDPVVKPEKVERPVKSEAKKAPASFGFGSGGSYYPYARKAGKTYHADKLAGLYIMYKTDIKTPGTDEGWVYGTVTADGKSVTSAGRVVSCMSCHEEVEHDRLFGMPRN